MYNASTPTWPSQRRIAAAMNSGPLSLRMCLGTPRIANSSASVSITSSLVMLRATFKRQTLPRVLVHDRQPLQLAAARRAVEHKIPTPHVVAMLGTAAVTSIIAGPQTPAFSPFLRHLQPLPTPQPKHSPKPARQPSAASSRPTRR